MKNVYSYNPYYNPLLEIGSQWENMLLKTWKTLLQIGQLLTIVGIMLQGIMLQYVSIQV